MEISRGSRPSLVGPRSRAWLLRDGAAGCIGGQGGNPIPTRALSKPIGVAGWETKIVDKLPKDLQGSLPTVEEIEAELRREEER